MSEPTMSVRRDTYRRDGGRCVTCGTVDGLQYQHRRAEGMGGRPARPGMPDGLTSCGLCNPEYEGRLQRTALRFGWKVRSWVTDRSRVPVYYPVERMWFLLLADGDREHIGWAAAMDAMRDVYGPAYDVEKGLLG